MKANQIISDLLSMLEQINRALCTNNTMHMTVIEKIRVCLDLFALKWRDQFSVLLSEFLTCLLWLQNAFQSITDVMTRAENGVVWDVVMVHVIECNKTKQ